MMIFKTPLSWNRAKSFIALAITFSSSGALALHNYGFKGYTPAEVSSGEGFAPSCVPELKPLVKTSFAVGMGPEYFFRPTSKVPKRNLRDFLKRVKVMTFNVMNLLESPGQYVWENGKRVFKEALITKPEWQTEGVFETIRRINPDIIALQEVEKLDALNQCTKKYLNDEYFNILVPGNDSRGINVSISFKKDLPIQIEVYSNIDRKHVYEGQEEYLYPRDLLVVVIKDEKGNPIAEFVVVHNKSQRGDGPDVGSVLKRTDEVVVQDKVIAASDELNPGIPVISMGDNNADLRFGTEFKPLWNSGNVDMFDILKVPKDSPLRPTEFYFGTSKDPKTGIVTELPRVASQLDGIIINKKAAARPGFVIAGGRVPFIRNGKVLDPPLTFQQRKSNFSDHLPLYGVFNFLDPYLENITFK